MAYAVNGHGSPITRSLLEYLPASFHKTSSRQITHTRDREQHHVNRAYASLCLSRPLALGARLYCSFVFFVRQRSSDSGLRHSSGSINVSKSIGDPWRDARGRNAGYTCDQSSGVVIVCSLR